MPAMQAKAYGDISWMETSQHLGCLWALFMCNFHTNVCRNIIHFYVNLLILLMPLGVTQFLAAISCSCTCAHPWDKNGIKPGTMKICNTCPSAMDLDIIMWSKSIQICEPNFSVRKLTNHIQLFVCTLIDNRWHRQMFKAASGPWA